MSLPLFSSKKLFHPLEDEGFEEELRVAEEMSFLDEYDLYFDPTHLEDTKDRVKMYEDIVDEQLLILDTKTEDDNAPLRDSQIRDLFGFSSSLDSEKMLAGGTAPRSADENNRNNNPKSSDFSPVFLERRSASKEQKLKETVDSICRSLRWYQNKIVKQIESTSEEVKLAPLLELNDHVASVLTKADRIAQNERDSQEAALSRKRSSTKQSITSTSSKAAYTPNSVSKEDANHGVDLNSVLNAVYALRRVVDREETLVAVENFISICELDAGEVHISAVKHMMNAGALQVLLSVLSRASEWPEVESQISKVVSVLVTYEDDWVLLQRSALVILSSLYTLQLKTHSRARSRSEALNRTTTGSGPALPEMIEALSSLSIPENLSNASEKLSLSISTPIDLEQQQSEDTRALVAAAVAKLSLVLSNEWSKQESPFGEFPIPVGASVMPVTNSFQHGLDRVEKMRSLITRHSKNIRPSINDGNNMDSNRVLQVLLNLILTISEASLMSLEGFDALFDTPSLSQPATTSQLRTPGKFGSSANTAFASNMILPALSASQSEGRDLSIHTANLTTPGINATEMNYQRIDQFLISTFGISFDSLLSGSMFPVKPKVVDNSAVLCSTALVNIAEVPHCRPGLVAGGALRMIKSWLEIGVNLLRYGQLICTDFLATYVTNYGGFQDFFIHLYGPVYELIANATAALMLLAGGSSDSKSNTGAYFAPSNPLHAGGGRDYIIGWIDAQILAEGLPEVLVNLVLASHQSFLQISPPAIATPLPEGTSPTTAAAAAASSASRKHQLSPCILPGQISKNIAKFLFQICSRPQNRSRLQGSSIPYVLCMIFEKSVAAVKFTIDHTLGLDSAHHSAEEEDNYVEAISGSYSPAAISGSHSTIGATSPRAITGSKLQQMNDLYRKIFEFGMIPASSDKENGTSNHSSSKSNLHFQSSHGNNYHHPHRDVVVKKADPHNHASPSQNNNNHTTRFFGTFSFSHKLTSSHNQQSNHENSSHNNSNQHNNYKIPPELLDIMSLITAACLDTIGYYFNDEIAQAQFRPSGTSGKPSNNPDGSLSLPLISLMCNQRIMAAILMVTSNLPKGPGRVAAIRIISSLTEWPESLLALYEASIMDALLLISSETEEFGNATTSKENNGHRVSEGPGQGVVRRESNYDAMSVNSTNAFPAKPGAAERASSNNSTISGISSCSVSKRSHSFHRMSNMFGGRSDHGGATPIPSISHLDDYLDDEELLHQDMALEETLYVCYSLANLCHSNPSYAFRMFTSGLLVIMSRLVKSSHPEISHQAVRCMNAMCSVIAVKVGSNEDVMTPRNNHRVVLRDTLEVLTEASRSQSPLVQKEAMLTIAQLCLVGEEFRDRVMDGCMRSITLISVNPNYPRELRAAAEEVLKNCGFSSGLKDFEICGFDYEILKEWYFLKRSLKPQEVGRKLLNLWVEQLFTDGEPLYGRQALLFSPSTATVGTLTASSFGALDDGLANNTGVGHNNELYQFSLAGEIGDLLKVTAFSWAKPIDSSSLIATTQQTLSGLPHLHRQLTDSFFRLLPICFPKFSDSSSHHPGSTHHAASGDDLDVYYPPRGSSMSSHQSRDSFGPQPTGGFMNRSAFSPPANASSHHQQLDNYSWIDRPPLIVTNMYDMFYSSRIHQLLVMDVTSIGVCIPVTTPQRASGSDVLEDDPDGEELAFLIPHPHPIYAVLLPSRTYQSFTRVGRVLQRMFETADPNQLWALSFRDCEYHGDFHTSLLATLQRCPQICSISFSSSNRVEDDALLGHLVGQIPSSVRFISFRSTLSHESIQALCILLRTHNAAFLNSSDFEDLDRMTTPTSNKHNGSFRSTTVTSIETSSAAAQYLKTYASPPPAPEYGKTPEKGPAAEGYANPVTPPSNKGLLGLSLTHLTLDAPEIQHIVELLQPRMHSHQSYKSTKGKGTYATTATPPMVSLKRGESQTSSNSSSTPKSVGKTAATATPFLGSSNTKLPPDNSAPSSSLRGLKYLDLGYNNLSDSDCAAIFKAAINGPLEGLELGGNMLVKAHKFIEALTAVSSRKQLGLNPNRLRYLGLANNNLSNKAFTGILYKLVDNTSLTGLDLSNNGIESTATNNESLRSFIKKNSALRFLDLSHNKLTTESYRLMHLGLLENSSLLMLPLYGNHQVETSPSVELIQVKLRENRLIYKAQSKDFSYGFTKGDTDYYPTEDISSRISFSGVLDIPPTIATSSTSTPTNTSSTPAVTATATIAILEGEDDLNEHLIPAEILKADPTPEKVPLGIAAAKLDHISPDESKTSSSSGSGSETKKLSILPPNEIKKMDVAIAMPVASPKNPTMATTATNAPSIPNTPRRGSGKFFTAELVNAGIGGGGAGMVSTGTMTTTGTNTASIDGNIADFNKNEDLSTHGTVTKVSPPFSSFANTLNVLFSAPLAGFDRSGKAHPLEVLDYTSERDTLIQVFKEVHRDIALHFDFATTDTLRTILSFGCKSLHFSGHGIPKGLCFEDGKSGLQVIRETQLKDLLSAGGLSLEFVFVSACYSKEIGEAFVKAGVAHVVCVKVDSKIPDSAAIAFTRAFYVAFLSGKTVKASFDIAKEALKLSPYVPDSVFEGDKFILLPEVHPSALKPAATTGSDQKNTNSPSAPPSINLTNTTAITDVKYHDKVLFANRISIEWPNPGQCTIGANRTDLKQFLTRIRIPSPPADFEGREVTMNSIIRNILDRRLVSLTGEDGVGKSAVAAAVCKYIADREFFADAIVYLKCKGYKDFNAFLHGLKHALLHSGNNTVTRRMQEHLSTHPHHQHHQHHHSATSSASSTSNNTSSLVPPPSTVDEEELIFNCLEPMRILLVLDHLDDLVSDFGETVTYFRLFLNRLFEQCPMVKVLNVSTDTLSMSNIYIGSGIVEYSVPLGPLTLNSTLRLFARLAPSLTTIHDKLAFIDSLQPPKQYHVTMNSREISNAALQILALFSEGHPAKIVHMACESTSESVEELKKIGKRIIQQSSVHPADLIGHPHNIVINTGSVSNSSHMMLHHHNNTNNSHSNHSNSSSSNTNSTNILLAAATVPSNSIMTNITPKTNNNNNNNNNNSNMTTNTTTNH